MFKKWQDSNYKIHSGELQGSKNEYDAINCNECGFSHVIPIPTESFLSEYYKDSFVKNRPKGFYEKMESDIPWLDIFYNEKYDLFEKYLKKKSPSILDVGSGLGFFLQCGKNRGWDILGVEASIESYNYCIDNGLKIVNQYLDDKNYKKLGSFDVVHMHEVIEHLPDPIKIIRTAKEMLKPNGLLCIASPNDFNPLQNAFVNKKNSFKWWISPPEHINYFNFNSMKKVLEDNGFNVIEQTSTFPLEFFLLMGDNYIGDSKIGKKVHARRVSFEKTLCDQGFEKLRRNIYSSFAKLGIGREFCIISKLNK
tara:strand:+ start:1688 stop:2614 length:927 start_codon:yes stop_codon:yes gene_type:complete